MTSRRDPDCLFTVLLDFPRELEDDTNRWFDNDHVPERLSCSGFLGCERYELVDVEPVGWTNAQRVAKYLNAYELESPSVLESPAYELQREMHGGLGSRWRQVRESRQRELTRRSPAFSYRWLWSRRSSAEVADVRMPPPQALYFQWRNAQSDGGSSDEFIDQQYVPDLLSVPGFLRCVRYEAASSDRSGSPTEKGQPRYMEIFHVSAPEVLTSEAFRWIARTERYKPATLGVVGSGIYLQRPSPWRLELPT